MQQKLHPGRRLGIGQILVGQPGHGVDKRLSFAGSFQRVAVGHYLSPARPGITQRHRHQSKQSQRHQQQRQRGRIGQAVVPKVAHSPAHHCIGQPKANQREAGLYQNPQRQIAVNVMAQLVRQHGFNFIVRKIG